ncbi:hypothetical protein [Agromyces sp. NPDC058104]|uniref:hypothetical protein n=1 Tax=Agromyces sp. NPDC058104 TaxID=3346342 RepID=UPI0036DAFC72
MEPIERALRAGGGVCRAADLADVPRRRLAAALAAGRVERLRHGVYGSPWIPEEAKRAVRVGGRLGCVSAARLHGLRVLNDPRRVHVALDAHASRPRHPDDPARRLSIDAPDGIRLHWSRQPRPQHGFIVPLEECLAQMLACLPALDALCALDSAREHVVWHGGGPPQLDEPAFARFIEGLPAQSRVIARRSSTLSQAVGETVARERLRAAGIPVLEQFELPGGFVGDLLVGERLVFDIEGERPHSAPGAFDRDRRRAAWLKACGFAHLAVSHRQVLHEWDEVESVVRLLMRRGVHCWGDGLDRPA